MIWRHAAGLGDEYAAADCWRLGAASKRMTGVASLERLPAASSPDPVKHAAVLGPIKAEPCGWP